ncbi:MAG: phosphatase PAP2 family protein [Verrucomicrobiota bacterium JB023]|nr:phosphatase PAP2 family protein [Verrucomicrobiota bacterium JB023]
MPSLPSKGTFLTVLLPLILLGALSLPFLFTPLDLKLQAPYYDAVSNSWSGKNSPFHEFLYKALPIPGILAGVLAFAVLVVGIGRPSLARHRKRAAFIFLLLLLGSGLVANAILKGEWGRPRPSETEQFGGPYPFEKLLHYDSRSEGKSFPCGHATMGFLFLGGYFLTRRRKLKALAIGIGLTTGLVMGWVRMSQGGHYASDTLWAAAVMWFTALGLAKALKLEQSLDYIPSKPMQEKPPAWVSFAAIGGSIFFIALGLLAWPRSKDNEEQFARADLPLVDGVLPVEVTGEGHVEIRWGDKLHFLSDYHGFGFPKSYLVSDGELTEDQVSVTYWRKGFFTELNNKVVITLPTDLPVRLTLRKDWQTLRLADGPAPSELVIDLPASCQVLTPQVPAGVHLRVGKTL